MIENAPEKATGHGRRMFSRGQLATLAVAGALVALIPGTTYAVDALTSVVLTDPNGAQATVSDDGRLAVEARPAGVPFRLLSVHRHVEDETAVVSQRETLTTSEVMVVNSGSAKAVFHVLAGTICHIPYIGDVLRGTTDLGLFVAGPASGVTYPLNPPETTQTDTSCGDARGIGYLIRQETNPLGEADLTVLGTTEGDAPKG